MLSSRAAWLHSKALSQRQRGEALRPSLRKKVTGIKVSSPFHGSGRPCRIEVHTSFINYPFGFGLHEHIRLMVPGTEFPPVLKMTVSLRTTVCSLDNTG